MENKHGIDLQSVIKTSQLQNVKQGPIQGTCLTMCPNDELCLRQRQNIIHLLESKVNQKGQRLEFADPKRMVKEFSRSAAGRQVKATDVRPLPVLRKTVTYLLCVVCSYEDVSWREIYDFVDDRLRAVRQDIVLQGLQGKQVIKILAPAARFYIYAHYRLCEYETREFDPCLNLQQLNEILLTILSIYKNNPNAIHSEPVDYRPESHVSKEVCAAAAIACTNKEIEWDTEGETSMTVPQRPESGAKLNEVALDTLSPSDASQIRTSNCTKSPIATFIVPAPNASDDLEAPVHNVISYSNIRCIPPSRWEEDNENSIADILKTSASHLKPVFKNSKLDKHTVCDEMISLYILIHIGRPEIISSVLQMPQNVRQSPLVSRVIKASLNWMVGNHIPLIRLSQPISPSLATAIHLHLNKVQRHALGVLSVAHSSKVVKYPTEDLRRYLLFPSEESLQKACQHYGLPVTGDGVHFTKSNFKWDVPVYKPEKADWLDNKLKNSTISELLIGYCMADPR